jgi:hypothetical protein
MFKTSSPLRTTELKKLRVKAIRAGVWFRVLPRIDRVLIDLTIKVTENIRSSSLAKSISAIVGKLEELTQSNALQSLRLFGQPLAQQISDVAQKLGNTAAKAWATDISFATFLAVIHMDG